MILTGASGGIGLEIIEELSKLDNILAIYKNLNLQILISRMSLSMKVDISNNKEKKFY